MSYTVTRFRGKVTGVNSEKGHHPKGTQPWMEFLEWNAKQPSPLDLSDQPPPHPPRDEELEEIDLILGKADGDITAAEIKPLLLKAMRRLRKRGVL